MKIKCRCGKEIDVKTHGDIADHWSSDGWGDSDILSDYASLLFKIHEKIEEYSTETFLGQECIKELKSLLD